MILNVKKPLNNLNHSVLRSTFCPFLSYSCTRTTKQNSTCFVWIFSYLVFMFYILRFFSLCLLLQTCLATVYGQRVNALRPDISVDSILKVKPGASKLALDPISKHLFYTSSNGNIYEVFEASQSDTLRFTANDHGLSRLQGLCFLDSTMYLAGNIWYSTTGIGMIMKGTLQANGTRVWTSMLVTEAYPTSSSSGDHGFTGINVDPSKHFLFFSGGSRTSFGEVQALMETILECASKP